MNRVVTSLPLPGLLRRAGWGVLLVPVVLLVASIFPWAIPWGVAAALAAAAVLLVPAVAADVATVGVIGLGIYASLLTSLMVHAYFW